MNAYALARGLHILAVIAWMAGMLFLPRLFAYDAEQNAKPEPLRTEHENFRDAVLGKDADIVTLEQGARVVQVCEAMIESSKTNKFVEIN